MAVIISPNEYARLSEIAEKYAILVEKTIQNCEISEK